MYTKDYCFNYKGTSVCFQQTFEDEKELAYRCFLEAMDYHLQDQSSINKISRLLRYFNKQDVWFMDILYCVTAADEQEQQSIKVMLTQVLENIQQEQMLKLIKTEYVDLLVNIIDKTEKDLDMYLHNYSCVDIPKIVTGEIQALV